MCLDTFKREISITTYLIFTCSTTCEPVIIFMDRDGLILQSRSLQAFVGHTERVYKSHFCHISWHILLVLSLLVLWSSNQYGMCDFLLLFTFDLLTETKFPFICSSWCWKWFCVSVVKIAINFNSVWIIMCSGLIFRKAKSWTKQVFADSEERARSEKSRRRKRGSYFDSKKGSFTISIVDDELQSSHRVRAYFIPW